MGRAGGAPRVARAAPRAQHPVLRRIPPRAQARPTLMKLKMLSPDDKLAEIKRLYYRTTRQTIQQDLAKALDLLKSMGSEEERERAAAYMDGLSQMKSDWAPRRKRQPK